MNNGDKHIESWSTADVQKYLRGELSAGERHALEKRSLDDPFLADALEGLVSAPTSLGQDLTELRARLDARVTKKRKGMALPLLKAAAVLVLLVGIGFAAYIGFLDTKTKERIAVTPAANAPEIASSPSKAAPPTAPPAANANVPTTASAPATASAQPPAHPAGITTRARAKTKTSLSTDAASPAYAAASQPSADKELAVVSDSLANKIDSSESIAMKLDKRDDTVAYNPLFDKNASFKKATFGVNRNIGAATSNLLSFSGRVLDFKNHPLAGAYLSFKSNGAGTVTDEKGYFNLYLPQKDTTRHLTVALTGFDEIEYALNTDDRTGNTIRLRQTPASLHEVVVTGNGAKRRETLAALPSDEPEVLDSLWINVRPVMGSNGYFRYLDSAKKKMSVDTTIHGIESISFQVDKKGGLTEFKIERSLSPAHDAGVIRLINEGPAWRMLRGRSARALVDVTFP